jgi:hypothetical protein
MYILWNMTPQACSRSYLRTMTCPKYVFGHILVLSRFLEDFNSKSGNTIK